MSTLVAWRAYLAPAYWRYFAAPDVATVCQLIRASGWEITTGIAGSTPTREPALDALAVEFGEVGSFGGYESGEPFGVFGDAASVIRLTEALAHAKPL